MIWPPVKAWTSKIDINGHFHFVAINYGGKLLKRWVVMMSVVDSGVVVKVSWCELVDSSRWKTGWDEINSLEACGLVNNKEDINTNNLFHPSTDSGLTLPITKNSIRPWIVKN